jgi:hypothetical protein
MLSRVLVTLTFATYLFATNTALAATGDTLDTPFTITNTSGDGRIPTGYQGIVSHDGYIWVLDYWTDRIYRVYPKTVLDDDGITVLHSRGDSDFNLPIPDNAATPPCAPAVGGVCGGGSLTFAQNYFWNASPVTDDIIKLDPVDGDNLESENTLSNLTFPSPTGITYDGTYFWIVDWQSNTLNKVLPEDGTVLASIPGPSSLPAYDINNSGSYARPFGVAWDGFALWVSDQEEDKIYRVNPADGSIIAFFNTPGTEPRDLAWDGEFLWHVDQGTTSDPAIYKIDSGVTPFGIIGCVEKNGIGIQGDVLLSQNATADQSSATDADGCFVFANFESGVPLAVNISESGNDEKPVLALTGADVTLLVGDTYADPGVVATDAEDGDISPSVTAVPDVFNQPSLIDTSAPSPVEGYTITYNVVDSTGNAADPITRTVHVLTVDVDAPVITLIGDNPLNVEQASSFSDPGATAIDTRDGDVSGIITFTGTVDTNTPGSYTIDYNVTDLAGNSATTVTRTVVVQDTTPPVISLTGGSPITLEKGNIYSELGATALDNIDGDLTASIITSGTVSANLVGSYVLTYNVSDLSGNAATTLTRTIDVVDTTAPEITLLGNTSINHELQTSFVDPGFTANDFPSEDLSASVVISGSVDTSIAGTYTLNYDLTDGSGNAAITRTRTVIVADTAPPTLTITGDNPLAHELGTTYTEQGASAIDIVDGDITGAIVISGDTVDGLTAGSYNVIYDIIDAAGNAAATQTRIVNVSDTTPPLVTLLGQAIVQQEQGIAYAEAGASASDNIDGDLTANIAVAGDTVDTNTAGDYTITYSVNDNAGNTSALVTRLVEVADRTVPVITLIDSNPLTHEVGTVFVDPGATASDNISGDISANITTNGAVNPNLIGTYTINYNVADAAGNAATTVSRDVNVVDTGAPTITLIGSNPILHELQTPFTDPGATAADAADGDLTGSISKTGVVDANTASTYTLSYDVTDSQTNSAPTVTRDVIVADRTAPSLALNGASVVNVEQGTSYTDAGATAADTIEGDLTGVIVVTGAIDINTAGAYIFTYNVSDSAGNAASQLVRTVNVIDTTIPIITLNGAATIDHEINTVFVDPGANATDNIDGSLTANITTSGSVNASVLGSYVISYNVQDSSGNAATTVTRTVNVSDTGAPVISLIGDNPIYHELNTTFTDPGATASDASDGNVTSSIVVTGSVNSAVAGTYTLTYNVTDSQANSAATVTRDVIVADVTAPIITLNGASTIPHEQGTIYTDLGATATDNIDGVITGSIIVTGNVAVNNAGTYVLNYNVSDSSGNTAATVVRTVIIADTTAPTIMLTGLATVAVEQGSSYTDAGATASDNIDGGLTGSIIVSGDTVDANIAGTYVIRYDVSDAAGNSAAQITRTVAVADTTAPIIALAGLASVNHEQGTTYTDAGATASDTVDGNLTLSIITNSTVNSGVAGTYSVTYNLSDAAGNSATTVTRTVIVADTIAPSITLTGASTVNVEQGSSYADAGATAADNFDGNLTLSITQGGDTVDPNTAGTYVITYNVNDAAGNPAPEVSRTVIVADTIAPAITLTGSPSITLEQQVDSYIEQGASASDTVNGDITGSIVIGGDIVNEAVAGTYIVTYNVSDAAGNPATTVSRTITVSDTTLPIITLTGASTVNVEQGSSYSDLGATANDNIDGPLTSSLIVSGDTVDANTAGTYIIRYDVSDTSGNTATAVTRTVIVADTIAPIITLTGSTVINHEQGTPYTDAGAAANDSFEGDLTAGISVTGTVNPNVAGAYVLSYDVSDSSSNAATTVTRTVTVVDTVAPTITITGATTINHEQGIVYVDSGATASDLVGGNLSGSIVTNNTVNTSAAGTYSVTYDVSDAAGNAAATVVRTVIVADTTLPTISLIGANPINVEQGTSFTDPGATANDNISGDISGSIVKTGSVDVNTAGTYTLSYNVSDPASNAALTVTRDVIVSDTTIPVITLNGLSSITIEQGTSYSDAGATANDNINGDISGSIVQTGNVNAALAGTYILNYNVADSSGNNASQVSRTVTVSDTIAPTIVLNGSPNLAHQQGDAYIDAGATATDLADGNISSNITVTGSINPNVPGSYVLTYNVTDTAGNAASPVIRTITVADTRAPTITLNGSSIVNHELGNTYTDAGATASDTVDGNITANIVVTGAVVDTTPGTYVISYDVVDAAGNVATTVTRTVNVSDTTLPVLTLSGATSIDLALGQLFVDPGYTASDNTDGNIDASVVVSGSIDINTEGAYILSYDVSDAAGNGAATQTRTINVVAPSIVSFEAETATIGGAHTVESTNLGFTGSGYVQHAGEGYVEYTFDAFSIPYDLVVRYAWDTGDRPLEVILNSVSLGTISFPATGTLTTWADTATLALTPISGSNTLRLQTTGASGSNLDALTLTPQ